MLAAAGSRPVTAGAEPRQRLGEEPAAAADVEGGKPFEASECSWDRGRNAWQA